MESYASCNANSKGRVEHVRRLLEHVFKLGIKVKLLLLDGGYYSFDVINCLNAAGTKFVMKMRDYGKIEAESGFIYTTNSPYRDEQAMFMVVAINGTDRYRNSELFIFVTNTDMDPRKIRKIFRKRWGLETSYRMTNTFLAKTTSKIYSVRRLYFCLAVLLATFG